jgi:putative phage-type endonuclease
MMMPELVCSAADRDLWLDARRQGVTATDIVAILGLSGHDSEYSLFWRKLGQVPDPPDNDRWRLGRKLEPYVVERWLNITDPESFMGMTIDHALYRSDARPWQLATPDAHIEPDGVLEVKSWADADRHSWDTAPPPSVRAQVLWQMDVMNVTTGHVGVLFLPSGEFRSYTIEHTPLPYRHAPDKHVVKASGPDETVCGVCIDLEAMREIGHEFYRRLRQELPPPSPDASRATLAAVKARFQRRQGKRGQVEWSTWSTWLNFKATIAEQETLMRRVESELREQLGEADEIEVGGELVGRRMIADTEVKAHTRHQDYIRRINPKGSDDDE